MARMWDDKSMQRLKPLIGDKARDGPELNPFLRWFNRWKGDDGPYESSQKD
jgi:hypothetical protein